MQVVAEAFSSHLGTIDFSSQEIDDQSRWLELLLQFDPAGENAEELMATRGPAAYIAAGTLSQQATPAMESPAGRSKGLRFGEPEVPARADVVVAPVVGRDGTDRLRGLFTGEQAAAAFEAAGWVAGPAEGATGLPAADLLVALRVKMDE